MLIFEDITLKNFLSFGNVPQTFKLNDTAFHIIVGMNKDKSADDENNRNGVGKTALFQAIHYSLYGKSIGNKITLSTLINNINKKNMEVTLNFKKDDVSYTIMRGRNPTYLRFYKNGEEVSDETLGDSRDTQEVIEQIVGMNEDLFCQTVLLSCQIPIFMEQSTANQKLIIEKILGVDVITEKIAQLKDLIKETKTAINNESFKVSTLKTQNIATKESLENQLKTIETNEKDWETSIATKIQSLEQTISDCSKIDYESEKDLLNRWVQYESKLQSNNTLTNNINLIMSKAISVKGEIDKLTQHKDEISKIDIEKEKQQFDLYDKIKQEEAEFLKEKQEVMLKLSKKQLLEREISGYTQKQKELEKQLNDVIQSICPTCGQPINADEVAKHKQDLETKIAELSDKAHKTNIDIMEIVSETCDFKEKVFEYPVLLCKSREELLSYESQLREYDIKIETHLKQLQELLKEKESIVLEDIESLKPEKESIFKSEVDLEKSKMVYNMAIEQLKEVKEGSENPYKSQKDAILKSLQELVVDVDEKPLQELLNDQEHNELLLKLLNSPSSYIRQSILDKSLLFLNSKIKMYLGKLGSHHIVKFNNDMSVDISANGLEFGYVSSGEMGRISLALTLAFREVWENLNNNSTNLLMIDEVLDRSGLDTNGIRMLIGCIKETVNKNILLVTHNDSVISSAQKIIKIVKENSFSKIES